MIEPPLTNLREEVNKILDRIIGILPIPILLVAAVISAVAWGIKQQTGTTNYRQIASNPAFQFVTLFGALGIVGYYGTLAILRARARPTFDFGQRGVSIARFQNDTQGTVQLHTVEELRTALAARAELRDVRVAASLQTLTDHQEALELARSTGAAACLWGAYVEPNIVHVALSTKESQCETRLTVVDFPNITSVITAILQVLEQARPSDIHATVSLSYLERQLDVERQTSQELRATIEALSKSVASRLGDLPPSSVATAELKRRRSVLLVGVSEYHSLPHLVFAFENANAIYDTVQTLWPESNRLISGQAVTRAELMESVNSLAREAERGDQIWFYFSGHAVEVADGGLYLLPSDTTGSEVLGGGVSAREVVSILGQSLAEQIVIILDTSYAGLLSIPDRPGMVIISSTGAQEAAMDHPSSQGGSFTRSLIEGLRGGADVNGDGFVSATELYPFVRHQMLEGFRERSFQQSPMLRTFSSMDVVLGRTE